MEDRQKADRATAYMEMILQAAAFPVPVSLWSTTAHPLQRGCRDPCLSLHTLQTPKRRQAIRVLFSTAEEHSRQPHQWDRNSLGGRYGILNSTGSKHNCILNPLRSLTQLARIILSWTRCFLLQSLCSHLKDTPPHASNQTWQTALQARVFLLPHRE